MYFFLFVWFVLYFLFSLDRPRSRAFRDRSCQAILLRRWHHPQGPQRGYNPWRPHRPHRSGCGGRLLRRRGRLLRWRGRLRRPLRWRRRRWWRRLVPRRQCVRRRLRGPRLRRSSCRSDRRWGWCTAVRARPSPRLLCRTSGRLRNCTGRGHQRTGHCAGCGGRSHGKNFRWRAVFTSRTRLRLQEVLQEMKWREIGDHWNWPMRVMDSFVYTWIKCALWRLLYLCCVLYKL